MLRDADQDQSRCALDVVASARVCLLDQLLRHEIRAASAQELSLRCNIVFTGHPTPKELDAVREDAAFLATRDVERARFGERRDVALEVKMVLTSKRHSGLGDRAIARMVGCSPTTVGKIRRQA